MKTTILGIEVGNYGVSMIKRYIHTNKKHRKNKEDTYTAWEDGYALAYSENTLREIRRDGDITPREEEILKRFLEKIEFPEMKIRLYKPVEWAF